MRSCRPSARTFDHPPKCGEQGVAIWLPTRRKSGTDRAPRPCCATPLDARPAPTAVGPALGEVDPGACGCLRRHTGDLSMLVRPAAASACERLVNEQGRRATRDDALR